MLMSVVQIHLSPPCISLCRESGMGIFFFPVGIYAIMGLKDDVADSAESGFWTVLGQI
jgi:hypothetical protein